MSEEYPEERTQRVSLQFSLRKLLLWTAVVAVYCGIGKLLLARLSSEAFYFWGRDDLIAVGCLVLLIPVVRAMFSLLMAWSLSTVAGGLAFVICLQIWAYAFYSGPLLHLGVYYLHYFILGCGHGWVIFALTEGLFRFVNWADNLIEKKTASRD